MTGYAAYSASASKADFGTLEINTTSTKNETAGTTSTSRVQISATSSQPIMGQTIALESIVKTSVFKNS